jgi:hypothetical protein
MMSNPAILALVAEFSFEKSATVATILFEVFVLGGTAGAWLVLRRMVDKFWLRFLVTAVGVSIFEIFTSPMWINERLGPWAYYLHDVSWILMIGWTALILGVVILVDHYLPHWKTIGRFATTIGILLVIVVALEATVVGLGIRSYAPEVLRSTSGILFLGMPIEVLYYAPVFMALVITFYKYWAFVIDDVSMIPVKKRKWLRAIALGFIAVFMFEIMVEPLVENAKLPSWSYVYNDVSLILTGLWVLLIAVGAVVVERYLVHLPIPLRFIVAVMMIGAVALPIESWLIVNGYRVYGPSSVARFSGFTTPISGVASEVAFAIPCYLALIIAFIRFWEITLDNQL